jgi:hypothetical protein
VERFWVRFDRSHPDIEIFYISIKHVSYIATCFGILIATWQVRTTFTGDDCMAYAASRHIVRADTHGVLS